MRRHESGFGWFRSAFACLRALFSVPSSEPIWMSIRAFSDLGVVDVVEDDVVGRTACDTDPVPHAPRESPALTISTAAARLRLTTRTCPPLTTAVKAGPVHITEVSRRAQGKGASRYSHSQVSQLPAVAFRVEGPNIDRTSLSTPLGGLTRRG